MDLGIAGKVALVTGASRGVGRAVAKSSYVTGAGWHVDGGKYGRI